MAENRPTIIEGVTVVAPEDMDQAELHEYVKRQKAKYKTLKTLMVVPEGDYVNLKAITPHVPFERIRRITGYLVGGMSRWNDAKRAEEGDRVKHT